MSAFFPSSFFLQPSAFPCAATMRRPPPRLFAHIVLLALLVAPCLGWGADGHRIVGTIASAALTDDVARVLKWCVHTRGVRGFSHCHAPPASAR